VTPSLADEIARYLAGSGRPEIAERIARSIGARTYNVRFALKNDPRFVLCPAERQRPSIKRYVVRDPRRPGDGRDGGLTHNAKVLALLSDGRPHSHLEVYDLRVVCHSRVSALRKLGHKIECSREGSLYWYTLLPQAAPEHLPLSGSGAAPSLVAA
jgi:hypothetical protein